MKVDVNAVCCGLLEREDVDRDAVQNVSGGSKKLDEAPTLLLIGLQYAGQHWDQLGLQPPVKKYETKNRVISDLLPNSKMLQCSYNYQGFLSCMLLIMHKSMRLKQVTIDAYF